MRDKTKSASTPAQIAKDPPVPGSSARSDHEEWLLDESLVETFPASDPIAPAVPPEPRPQVSRGDTGRIAQK